MNSSNELVKNARHEIEHQTYILTCDLSVRMKSLAQLGISLPPQKQLEDFFLDFQAALEAAIQNAVPANIEVESINVNILAEQILARALRQESILRDAVIVSTCFEVSTARRGITLEINRLVDLAGGIIGLGPRPGHPDLFSQIRAISHMASEGRPVVLIEDGSFSGKTLRYVLEAFAKEGIKVASLIVGICFPEMLALGDLLPPSLEMVTTIDQPYEWMPDHDFFPFAPNCGRVLGVSFGKDILPYYTYSGATFSFPYIQPFGDLEEWASIPKNRSREISLLCLSKAREFFQLLEQINEKPIRCMDLIGAQPRVSIPLSIGQSVLPDPSSRVVDFLHEALEEIW